MSEKTECPGCGAFTSRVWEAAKDGEPCPHCGLSAQSMAEIMQVRRSHADEELKGRLTAALKRADAAEQENLRLHQAVRDIGDTLSALRSEG